MKTLITIVIGLVLIFLGEELALYVYANYYLNSSLALLGILAFTIIASGATLITYQLAKQTTNFDQWVKDKSIIIKALIYPPLLIICLTPYISSVVLFYKNTNAYHQEQLDNHGVIAKVKITDKIDRLKSRHDLLFRYEYDGTTYKGMLNRWKYDVGDSVLILFSSENPGEVAWYEKYKNQRR